MFVDRIKVFAQAGNGGRGCVSFRREKFVPRGGPDGGDGGRGGDVILQADVHTDNLTNLFYEPVIKAKSGGHGQGKKMHGRGAPSKVVKVPIGTIVYRAEPPAPRSDNDDADEGGSSAEALDQRGSNGDGEQADADSADFVANHLGPGDEPGHGVLSDHDQLADLSEAGQEFVLCAGGKGGKGNVHFKSSRNRAPVQFTDGEEGEQGYFLLDLRTIADAALVGYPNAGKST